MAIVYTDFIASGTRRWSRARWHLSDGRVVDPLLPKIRGVPWGLFVK